MAIAVNVTFIVYAAEKKGTKCWVKNQKKMLHESLNNDYKNKTSAEINNKDVDALLFWIFIILNQKLVK